jgi:hypothetical protein
MVFNITNVANFELMISDVKILPRHISDITLSLTSGRPLPSSTIYILEAGRGSSWPESLPVNGPHC